MTKPDPTRTKKIMIVEDSVAQAMQMRIWLESNHWEVIVCNSAEVALDKLTQARPDLIIMDFFLPGMQGNVFCSKLRMTFNTRTIPILILTTSDDQKLLIQGLDSGADDYFKKSPDPTALIA